MTDVQQEREGGLGISESWILGSPEGTLVAPFSETENISGKTGLWEDDALSFGPVAFEVLGSL